MEESRCGIKTGKIWAGSSTLALGETPNLLHTLVGGAPATQEGNIRIAFYDFQKKRVMGSMEFKTVGGVPTLALIDDSGKTLWSTQLTR